MQTTLPTFTATIDTVFTNTWYEMRKEAADNITQATPFWAALKDRGCFTSQAGGNLIERSIEYAIGSAVAVDKTTELPSGEPELETAAFWKWHYVATHVQRDTFTDSENAGKFKIKDYVQQRLMAARQAMIEKNESMLNADFHSTETHKEMQSINDVVPPYTQRAAGTFGRISRSNPWWQANYKELTANPEINMVSDMKNFFNTISNNQESPNLIVASKDHYEIYEDFGLDASQITIPISGTGKKILDLGFQVINFKGQPMIWTNQQEGMLFLNTNWIEVVYNPLLFMTMGRWKDHQTNELRIAHILEALSLITNQPRRHGRLYATTGDGA